MRLVVLGQLEKVSYIYGNVFESLGTVPIYVNPDCVPDVVALKPDAILLGLEWVPSWRMLVAQARRAGIPVIYVMDGVIEWSYLWNNQSYAKPQGTVLQPLMASVLAVVGRHPARILASLGLADRIHIIGLPRLDKFKPVREVRPSTVPRIVITTAKTLGHNTDQKLSVIRALSDMEKYFTSRTDVQPIWRIDRDVARDIGVNAENVGSIDDVLRQAAGLISFTSTTLLEGMAYGMPTAQVEYRPVPIYVQTAWEIRSKEHISAVVQELLYPPAEKMAYQDACLEDELEAGNASDRLAEIIRFAIDNADSPSLIVQKSNIYPRLDYRQVHSNISAFSISSTSVLQYELEGAYQKLAEERQRFAALESILRASKNRGLLRRLRNLFRIDKWFAG